MRTSGRGVWPVREQRGLVDGGQHFTDQGPGDGTPAGTKTVPSLTWAVYRDVNSLDPIYAFDYPENTADSLMCESLLRQAPDGSLQPGLASVANPPPPPWCSRSGPG